MQGSEAIEMADDGTAGDRAAEIGARQEVKAWMRRVRKLMKEQPADTWIYMQEDQLHLMARSADGRKYINHRCGGSCQASSIDSVLIPGADAGAW